MNRKWKVRLLISLVVALCLALAPIFGAFATNPTVVMHVTAGIVSITNTEDAWELGHATVSQVKWFSADSKTEDDNYSTANNTGNLPVDIAIEGTDFTGDYTWTLASINGTEEYCLYANSGNGTSTYNTQVKKAATYSNLVENLGVGCTYVWSMKFTAPDEFNASENYTEKTATVTLVASEHT
jgi:hypothetical protein